jgi:isocitrate dehydrogenase kinase/phosphatase
VAALAPRKKRRAAKLVISIYRDVRADLAAPNRPRDLKALERHIQCRFGPQFAPDKVQAVIDRLKTSDAISVVGDRLVYGSQIGDIRAA